MIKTLVKNYIELFEIANQEKMTKDEKNSIFDAMMTVHELIVRIDSNLGYMMGTFPTYQKTVEYLKEVIEKL